jgi:DNA-binding response OmpR family regulator
MSFSNTGAVKILIVEDDAFMQTILKEYLGKNYDVAIAANGLDALALLQGGDIPDLIITDLNTPMLNGLDLIKQLRAGNVFNAIPIMVLSGEDSSEMRINCLDAGAEDYMVKPFNPRELESRLKVILRRMGK